MGIDPQDQSGRRYEAESLDARPALGGDRHSRKPGVHALAAHEVPPDAPVGEVWLTRLVVVRSGALTTAGTPLHFPCSCPATIDELFVTLEEADLGAREQITASLGRSRRRNEIREIRRITIAGLRVRDYRKVELDDETLECARQTLGNGNGHAPWRQVAKLAGGGVLLPRPHSLILFAFKSRGSLLSLGETIRTVDVDDLLPNGARRRSTGP